MTQIWNGERLPPGPTAVVLFESPPSGNQPSLPLIAAAAAGNETIVFELDRLGQFFTLHRDRELRAAAAALLETTALKLAPENARWILASRDDLEVSPAELSQLQTQMLETFPVL
jgi:hypothetical protein